MAKNLKIKPEELAGAVAKAMSEYVEATDEEVKKASKNVAEMTVDMLKETSPRQPHGGQYAESWTTTAPKSAKRHKNAAVVYNKKYYMLTHLLEYGHALHQGGRAEAHEHIKPAEEWAVGEFLKEIKEGISK